MRKAKSFGIQVSIEISSTNYVDIRELFNISGIFLIWGLWHTILLSTRLTLHIHIHHCLDSPIQ